MTTLKLIVSFSACLVRWDCLLPCCIKTFIKYLPTLRYKQSSSHNVVPRQEIIAAILSAKVPCIPRL